MKPVATNLSQCLNFKNRAVHLFYIFPMLCNVLGLFFLKHTLLLDVSPKTWNYLSCRTIFH